MGKDEFEVLTTVPHNAKDITGLVKGRLTVVGIEGRYTAKNGVKTLYWKCLCVCGSQVKVSTSGLHQNSATQSCGCLKRENSVKHANKMNKEIHRKHGKSHHRLYDAWRGMTQRVTNTKDKDFMNYGGRGIGIDPKWLPPAEIGFENFLLDMLESYREGFTIERLDNNLDYNKDNCKWVSQQDQAYNKRNSRKLPNAYPDGANYKAMLCYNKVNYYIGMFPTEVEAFIAAIHFRENNGIPIPEKLLNIYKDLTDE